MSTYKNKFGYFIHTVKPVHKLHHMTFSKGVHNKHPDIHHMTFSKGVVFTTNMFKFRYTVGDKNVFEISISH